MPARYSARRIAPSRKRERFARFAFCLGCCLASLSLGAGLFLLDNHASRTVFAQDKLASFDSLAFEQPPPAEPVVASFGWQTDDDGNLFYLDQNGSARSGSRDRRPESLPLPKWLPSDWLRTV